MNTVIELVLVHMKINILKLLNEYNITKSHSAMNALIGLHHPPEISIHQIESHILVQKHNRKFEIFDAVKTGNLLPDSIHIRYQYSDLR